MLKIINFNRLSNPIDPPQHLAMAGFVMVGPRQVFL